MRGTGDSEICVCSALTDGADKFLDGGAQLNEAFEKHLAEQTHELLSWLNLAPKRDNRNVHLWRCKRSTFSDSRRHRRIWLEGRLGITQTPQSNGPNCLGFLPTRAFHHAHP